MADRDYTIAAVDRAMRVLEALAEKPDQGVTEIAQRLGLTKSLVFRILATLEARAYVSRDPEAATFSLGYRAAVLGERAERQRALLLAAQPEMDRLNETTAENVNLLVRDGLQALVIGTREGRHSMRLFAQVGRHGPLHAGGASTLLLAYAPEEVRRDVLAGPLHAYTARTQVDPAEIEALLARIRARGWHVAQDDLDEGAFSVAAPILSVGGDVVAAISVAGAVARFDETRRNRYLDAVIGAARSISARLGGPSGGGASDGGSSDGSSSDGGPSDSGAQAGGAAGDRPRVTA